MGDVALVYSIRFVKNAPSSAFVSYHKSHECGAIPKPDFFKLFESNILLVPHEARRCGLASEWIGFFCSSANVTSVKVSIRYMRFGFQLSNSIA